MVKHSRFCINNMGFGRCDDHDCKKRNTSMPKGFKEQLCVQHELWRELHHYFDGEFKDAPRSSAIYTFWTEWTISILAPSASVAWMVVYYSMLGRDKQMAEHLLRGCHMTVSIDNPFDLEMGEMIFEYDGDRVRTCFEDCRYGKRCHCAHGIYQLRSSDNRSPIYTFEGVDGTEYSIRSQMKDKAKSAVLIYLHQQGLGNDYEKVLHSQPRIRYNRQFDVDFRVGDFRIDNNELRPFEEVVPGILHNRIVRA